MHPQRHEVNPDRPSKLAIAFPDTSKGRLTIVLSAIEQAADMIAFCVEVAARKLLKPPRQTLWRPALPTFVGPSSSALAL